MSDLDDQLARMLAARAEQVHSDLSGPAIRARAERRTSTAHRYLPLVAAVGVAVVALLGLVFLPGSTNTPIAPAVTTSVTGPPAPTTTHTGVSTPAPEPRSSTSPRSSGVTRRSVPARSSP
jgi:hypothetical protein